MTLTTDHSRDVARRWRRSLLAAAEPARRAHGARQPAQARRARARPRAPGAPRRPRLARGGLDPAAVLKPLADSWPTYSGDMTGPPLQLADADQPDHGEEPDAGAGPTRLVAGVRRRGRRLRRRSAAAAAARRSSSAAKARRTSRRRRAERQGRHPAGERHPLRDRAGQRLGHGRARRPRAVALLLEDARAARTSATAARRCGATTCSSKRPTTTSSRSTRGPGKERWHVEIADFNQQYFSTMAPIVIGDHVLVGTGNDLDAPGFLQSYDPETGKRKWIFYTVPMKAGDPGLDTWPSLDRGAARRRAGLDPRRLRSGDQAVYLRHRQSDARLHRRRPQGRQPLHLLAGGGERRYRQDGVVLPDVAARHARLGLGADADPDRRRRSPASRASWSRPRRATATSSRSTASPASTSSPPSTARPPTGRKVHPQDGSARAESGEGSDDSRARWCRRSKAASSTGSRPPTRRIPACSTRRRTTASRCST